ncbi:hypothetical protein [Micromonospora sp. WMMC250]|uniref:hypothetical protein n=1 Tax=Micromonospora sp. WMMC250 TaxID=3014781 RepID=UPI0022B634C2|nr:hypothetical protein [Micromonospora sp. WMMC250]MCZ7376775.1 hypothetical protein [Micromonospora sp. WMMC250]
MRAGERYEQAVFGGDAKSLDEAAGLAAGSGAYGVGRWIEAARSVGRVGVEFGLSE